MLTLRQACTFGAAALWLVHATAAAGPTSPECKRALDELQQREAQLPARGAAAPAVANDPKLRALRSRTASICLGGPDEASQPANAATPAPAPAGDRARSALRATEGPIRIPPITILPAQPRRVAPLEPLPPLPAPRSPTVVLGCDAAGCWSSDGSRLQRMGPNLVGPSGQCVLGGSVIQCP